ncbi:MAG: hypothetical protein MZV63_24060 [Marinilabiliales bacterium]|nr:hypothetical protein [Marinilabiliales bacterium]
MLNVLLELNCTPIRMIQRRAGEPKIHFRNIYERVFPTNAAIQLAKVHGNSSYDFLPESRSRQKQMFFILPDA